MDKKIFIETYGCQMNMYDTELINAILEKAEYSLVKDEKIADVIMLNTCAIRENAHRKVYGRIHEINHDREERKVARPKIGILGCMATNLRTELFNNRKLAIDFIAGPDSYKSLPALIEQSFNPGTEKPIDVSLSEFETYSDVFPSREVGVTAWIAVMRGCNNFCTFCVVPYTRGRERSRSVDNVVDEVKRLADAGVKQITLLGQNVNSYYHEEKDFADLLDSVSKVNGIERLRFTSPHPKDFPEKLLHLIAENPKICKQVHMPLQSGNDRILDLMNRSYTQKEYLELIDKTRKIIPGVSITTDVIIGFCSETDEEFLDTYKVMEQVQFDWAFMFKYSQRKNTVAEKKMKDDVPEAIKTERIVKIQEMQKEVTLKKYAEHFNRTEKILIEGPALGKHSHLLQGRTDDNILTLIEPGNYGAGDMLDVKIIKTTATLLHGEPVNAYVSH